MIFDEIKEKLNDGKSEIKIRGPIATYPTHQIWCDVKITNFIGQPISSSTLIDENVRLGFNACTSGSLFGPPYPVVYRIDNTHGKEGLHQHEGESVSKIETKTIGETLVKFFDRFLKIKTE
jgi:hypothetical protein